MAKPKKFKLGIVADLSPGGSIHQQTFIRAVNAMAEAMDFSGKNITLVWENDRANAEGGLASSKILVRKGVNAVLGHFASAAAKAALPQYEKKGIPLLLPASTANVLTEQFRSAFRICSKDSDLAVFLLNELKKKKAGRLHVAHDGSVHGQALAGDLVARINRSKQFSLHTDLQSVRDVIFVGLYRKSVEFAQQLQHAPGRVRNIYFTDDAVHAGLAEALKEVALNIFVAGFDDRLDKRSAAACIQAYREKWGTLPNTYYLETCTAMQVAEQLWEKTKDRNFSGLVNELHAHSWHTALGRFRFTSSGENRMKHFALWTLKKNGLQKENAKAVSAG